MISYRARYYLKLFIGPMFSFLFLTLLLFYALWTNHQAKVLDFRTFCTDRGGEYRHEYQGNFRLNQSTTTESCIFKGTTMQDFMSPENNPSSSEDFKLLADNQFSIEIIEGAQAQEKNTEIYTGDASWYSYCLDSGWCSQNALVCAVRHKIGGITQNVPKALPIERYEAITVRNPENGKQVRCKVTDYGPDPDVWPDRIVDLSPAAFEAIRGKNDGIIKNVIIEMNPK